MSLREKARLSIWIAQDLAETFGGRKANYLIPLNKKLKMKMAVLASRELSALPIAAQK